MWLRFGSPFLSATAGAGVFETIQLSDTDLIISKSDANGRLQTTRFEPYWAKVSLQTIGADKNILTISHHDKLVELGSFLIPHERQQVASTLKEALALWRAR